MPAGSSSGEEMISPQCLHCLQLNLQLPGRGQLDAQSYKSWVTSAVKLLLDGVKWVCSVIQNADWKSLGIMFYWVGLTLIKLKRNFHFISGYTFNAFRTIQKWLFLLPAWQCISQNPFHRLLYILKLVSEEGTLPVIFLSFSWKRIRHIYCPCICNHGKVSYLLWCLCGNAAVFSWKCVKLPARAFISINIFIGTFLTDVFELNYTIFSADLGLCVL